MRKKLIDIVEICIGFGLLCLFGIVTSDTVMVSNVLNNIINILLLAIIILSSIGLIFLYILDFVNFIIESKKQGDYEALRTYIWIHIAIFITFGLPFILDSLAK